MPGTLQSIAELLGLIVIFVLVLVVCYYTTKFVAGRQLEQKRGGNFELIESFALMQNKYLQLVRMGEKYVVISVTKDSVRYITELSKEEVCLFQKQGSEGKSFKEFLAEWNKKSDPGDTEKKENSTNIRKG